MSDSRYLPPEHIFPQPNGSKKRARERDPSEDLPRKKARLEHSLMSHLHCEGVHLYGPHRLEVQPHIRVLAHINDDRLAAETYVRDYMRADYDAFKDREWMATFNVLEDFDWHMSAPLRRAVARYAFESEPALFAELFKCPFEPTLGILETAQDTYEPWWNAAARYHAESIMCAHDENIIRIDLDALALLGGRECANTVLQIVFTLPPDDALRPGLIFVNKLTRYLREMAIPLSAQTVIDACGSQHEQGLTSMSRSALFTFCRDHPTILGRFLAAIHDAAVHEEDNVSTLDHLLASLATLLHAASRRMGPGAFHCLLYSMSEALKEAWPMRAILGRLAEFLSTKRIMSIRPCLRTIPPEEFGVRRALFNAYAPYLIMTPFTAHQPGDASAWFPNWAKALEKIASTSPMSKFVHDDADVRACAARHNIDHGRLERLLTLPDSALVRHYRHRIVFEPEDRYDADDDDDDGAESTDTSRTHVHSP